MNSPEQIIEAKYLSVCSASEAVEWLRQRRAGIETTGWKNTCYEEDTLERRGDPYIDFGLGRYGTCASVARRVYSRGDLAIRCTFLAHFPHGGFDRYGGNDFKLADEPPRQIDELNALVCNASLTDDLLKDCFEKQGVFGDLNEKEHQAILMLVKDNPRLARPDDRLYRLMDGFKQYSHDSVFSAAWALAEKVPNTINWAGVLYGLLRKCPLPFDFDPIPILERWHFASDDQEDVGFYLRSRLADVLEANDALLTANDAALRVSFYERFLPTEFPDWSGFAKADSKYFLEGALSNKHLWRKAKFRNALEDLCRDHPDEQSHAITMIDRFRLLEDRMHSERPEWFKEERQSWDHR